ASVFGPHSFSSKAQFFSQFISRHFVAIHHSWPPDLATKADRNRANETAHFPAYTCSASRSTRRFAMGDVEALTQMTALAQPRARSRTDIPVIMEALAALLKALTRRGDG